MNRNDWLTRLLPNVALVAFLVVAVSTEYTLAHDVMKLHWAVALGVPATIDSYVVAAFRARRDIPVALVVKAASLSSATLAHMLTPANGKLPPEATFAVTGAVLLTLVVVLWRIHVITEPAGAVAEQSSTDPTGPVVQVRTETVTVTATRSVAYLPATYVRTIEPDPIGSIESTRRAVEGVRSVPAERRPIRSTAPIRSIGSAPRSGSPDPTRSGSAEWIRRSRIGSDDPIRSDDAALLADFRRALAADPIPAADAIRSHYRIAPARARALRDAIRTDRSQPGAGGVEGETGS